MSVCQSRKHRKISLTQTQGDFVRAARRAAANPSTKNLADVEKTRRNRDEAREALDSHYAGCEAA